MKYTGQFNEKNFLHRPAVLSLSMNQAFFIQCPNIFAHDCMSMLHPFRSDKNAAFTLSGTGLPTVETLSYIPIQIYSHLCLECFVIV